jgi:hypothetical protein
MSTLLKAKSCPRFLLITAFLSLLSLLYKNPGKIHTCTLPITHPIHQFIFSTPLAAEASFCFFVNKSLNPSSHFATFLTTKYGHLRLRSLMEGARDIMIHNVYHSGNLSLTTSENHPTDEPLSVDTREIFSHVSAALSDTSAYRVLLGDFNIHNPIWEGRV